MYRSTTVVCIPKDRDREIALRRQQEEHIL